jgi:hypothetical protein
MDGFHEDDRERDDSGSRQVAELQEEFEELKALSVRLSAMADRFSADRKAKQRVTWRTHAGSLVILTLVLAIGLLMGVTLPFDWG